MLLEESSHIALSSRAADQEVKTDRLKHNSEEQFSSGEEAILPPRHLAMSRDISDCHNLGEMGAPTGRGQ